MFYSLHALLEDGVPPGLTDDQIGPLHDDYANKEGSVAGELHDLSLLISLKTKQCTGFQPPTQYLQTKKLVNTSYSGLF